MLRSIFVLTLFVGTTQADPLSVLSWNVESGGADPATIASELSRLPRADVFLFQEVAPSDIGRYAAAIRQTHAESYKCYLGSLGGSDRLAIIVDEELYRVREFTELLSFEEFTLDDWQHRPPLVVKLERKSDGFAFLLVNVHLAGANADLRTNQARGLRAWAAAQSLPIFLVGVCNFEYEFEAKRGNEAYDAFIEGNVWRLLEPLVWLDTNWADSDGDGRDDSPKTCLDFAAMAAKNEALRGDCRILLRENDFPDTDATSDHRPIYVTVSDRRRPESSKLFPLNSR